MAVTKPTDLPEWATSATAHIDEPPYAKKQEGWVSGEHPPAEWFNWWQEIVYDWCNFLDGYLSTPGANELTVTASSGLVLTSSTSVNITSTGSGFIDLTSAAALDLTGTVVTIDGSGIAGITFTSAAGSVTSVPDFYAPRLYLSNTNTVTKHIGTLTGSGSITPSTSDFVHGFVTLLSNTDEWSIPLNLPHGASLISLDVQYRLKATGRDAADTLSIELKKRSYNSNTASAVAAFSDSTYVPTDVSTVVSKSFAGTESIVSTKEYFVRVVHSLFVSAIDVEILSVRYTYNIDGDIMFDTTS